MSQEILKEISFDAVIPSALLFNNNIEPNAIKLYAFVRGLTRLEGYCYATNSYLSECMGCDESTVKRLLKSLKDEKFIEIETDKIGIHWQRRIYIGVEFKKCLRRLKNEPPPAQNCAPPSSKMSHNRRYLIRDIEKEEREASPPAAGAASPDFQKKPKEEKTEKADRVWINPSQHASLVKKADGNEELVKQWYDRLSSWKIGKNIGTRGNDYAAILKWVVDAVQEDRFNNSFIAKEVKNASSNQFLKRLKEKYGSHPEIEIGDQGVTFIAGNYTISLKMTDHGFQEQVLNRLRKMNLSIEGI